VILARTTTAGLVLLVSVLFVAFLVLLFVLFGF
jgi:hypothetical protein